MYEVDITNEEQLWKSYEDANRSWLSISVCIAAAGRDLSFIPHHKSMADMSLGQWNRTINTNLTGSFLTARAWMRGIRAAEAGDEGASNTCLIVFSSEAATMGVQSNADYSSSKAGLHGLVASLAPAVVNIRPSARVNAVAPGPVDTAQFRKECAEDPQVKYVDAEATVAQKRPVPVEVVARTCLYLASERFSGSVTGQIIHVDGGKSGKLMYLSDGTPCS